MKVKYTLEKRLEILDEWNKANNGSRNAVATSALQISEVSPGEI